MDMNALYTLFSIKEQMLKVCDKCKKKKTLLNKESKNGRKSTIQLLLDKGADINSCCTIVVYWSR